MKKLTFLILSFIFIFSIAYAEKIEVVKTCYIRSSVTAKDNQGLAKPGEQFVVMEKIGAWHFIEITDGSDHVGQKGWAYYKLLDTENFKVKGDTSVQGVPGIVLHEKPSSKSPTVCNVKSGASYKLLKIDTKWIKVAVNKYIFIAYVKFLE